MNGDTEDSIINLSRADITIADTERTTLDKTDKTYSKTMRKDMNCLYTNVRSILNNSKREEVKLLLNDKMIDILALTESWTHDGVSDAELNFEGYTLFRRDRLSGIKTKGGGLLLYCKNDLHVERVSEDGGEICESIWLKVADNINNKFLLGLFYRSPSSSQDEFIEITKQIRGHTKGNVIILGDFNFPDIDWNLRDASGVAKDFLNVLDDCFLHQHVMEPTRGNNTLDLILTTEHNSISDVNITCPISNSDHNTITFKIICDIKYEKVDCIKYNYDKANFRAIQEELAKLDWVTLFESKDVNDMWTLFKNILIDNRNKFVPKMKSNSNTKGKRVMWMTKKIKKSIKKRNKAWDVFKENRQLHKLNQYKKLRNQLTNEIRNAKRKFEEDLSIKIKQSPKAFYAYVGSKTRVRDRVGPLVDKTGKVSDNIQEMSEILNDYFGTVFTRDESDKICKTFSTGSLNLENKITLNNITLSQEIILDVINKLKPGKNGGVDEINSSYLLGIAEAIALPLLLLFNESIDSGVVPDDWRKANVTPIFKKGSRKKPDNYRPVSLTSNICKSFERLITNEITRHLEECSLIKSSQHGFRKNKSCLTNLLETTEEIRQILDTGCPVDIIYLDFQKAFDKVSHNKLKLKLRNCRIDGKLLTWIMSWLKDRKQRVVLDGVASGWTNVMSGVPQGSVLGPLLFTIFINDLDDGLWNSVKKFADDTKLFGKAGTDDQVNSLKEDLGKLLTWADNWLMKFNIEKCKVMHLGTKNRCMKYVMDGKELQVVKEEKDLGIYFENNFKVSNQCLKAAKKGNQVLGMIARAFTCKNKVIMLNLYKSLVRPHLEYCIQAWRPHLVKDKKVLEKVQRRASRMITECKGMTYNERLNVLRLTSLETRRERADLLEVYKILQGLEGVQEKDFFIRDLTNRRGHSYKLFIKRFRMDIAKYSFGNRVCNTWNRLPEAVVGAPSVNIFKNKLDHYLRLIGD